MSLLTSLFHSIFFIFAINTASLLTSLGICHLYKEPFIDYSKQYSVDYKREKTSAVTNYFFYSVINHHLFYWAFSSHSIVDHSQITSNLVNIPNHYLILYDVWRYLEYIALLEFFFYLFHRLSHTPYFYKHFHSHHHKNITLYPIDAIDSDYFDNFGFTFSLHFPLLLVPLTYYEYAFLYTFYSTGIILLHSCFISDIHVNHHIHFNYNYCLLFPFYEYTFYNEVTNE